MICSIHQPNYIPYLGLFDKIKHSDIFVFYDIAQYTKWDYHNRNSIKWSNWPILLSLPVSVKLWQTIKETRFDNEILQKHLKSIKEAYRKAKYYDNFVPILEEIYSYSWNNLSEFNINFIIKISKLFWFKTKFFVLSDLIDKLETKSTDALIDICKLVWAKKYISGAWWKNYIEEDKFIKGWISLHYHDFHHPIYTQLWWEFIPYMSVIDFIFNEGFYWEKI
jgi:hypothetical protein